MVRTDHYSFVWLMQLRRIEGKFVRWLEELSQFDMEMMHRPGNEHTYAEAMSRLPAIAPESDCYVAGVFPENFPSGGFSYCVRAHH
jgi:hypothetical protein